MKGSLVSGVFSELGSLDSTCCVTAQGHCCQVLALRLAVSLSKLLCQHEDNQSKLPGCRSDLSLSHQVGMMTCMQ